MQPVLVLLNGGPASGKSTLARAWAARHPLALALDVDTLRSMVGAWPDHPHEAGLAARAIALAAARTHLASGFDVMVPQYLARPGFADQLAVLAGDVGVPFLEIALIVDSRLAERRFRERAASGSGDAALHGALAATSMAEVMTSFERFLTTRPALVRVDAHDDVAKTALGVVESAIEQHRVSTTARMDP